MEDFASVNYPGVSTLSHYQQAIRRMGILLPLVVIASGCDFLSPASGQSGGAPGGQGGRPEQADGPTAVETAIAETGFIAEQLTYTGTTQPSQQVSLRSQVSGEIINLLADIGDTITQGALLAQLDGDIQTTNLNQARAELSARQAETAQAEVSIRDAQAAVVQAQATYDQAQIDANRLRQLANQGAVSQQEAEAAELAAANAQQAIASAQAQVNAQRQAVASAADQVDAQRAVLAQNQKQLSYTDLRSPLTGVVLSRQADVGDFVESGATVLELGDLSTLEVTVQVSELDIAQLSVGQQARVELDAFPGEGSILGRIQRISPVADANSRLIPVQVTIPNLDGRIGSGLLARVQFSPGEQEQVMVPTSALDVGQEENTIFVVEEDGEENVAIARQVRTGDRNQNNVEILSGLSPGDAFILRSDRPLTAGQPVRLSILSETPADSVDAEAESIIDSPTGRQSEQSGQPEQRGS